MTRLFVNEFVHRHGRDLAYGDETGWLRWTGERWRPVEFADVKMIAAELRSGLGDSPAARSVDGPAKLTDAVRWAQLEPAIRLDVERLDADSTLLNTPAGTVLLPHATAFPHVRADHLTKMTQASYRPGLPSAFADEWLSRALPDENVRDYLRRQLAGALTGKSAGYEFHVWAGAGTSQDDLADAFVDLLGDYAHLFAANLLKPTTRSTEPEDIMRLNGARFAVASGVNDLRALDSGRLWRFGKERRSHIARRRGARDDERWQATHVLTVPVRCSGPVLVNDRYLPDRARVVRFADVAEPDTVSRLRADGDWLLSWVVDAFPAYVEHGLFPFPAATETLRRTDNMSAQIDTLSNSTSA